MANRLNVLLLLSTSSLLTSCGGDSNGNELIHEVCGEDTEITFIDDLLYKHQWYLENRGQSALTIDGTGGSVGEDINIGNSASFAQGYSGDCIKVAVIDTGLEINHADLRQNIAVGASYNFANNGLGIHDPSPVSTDGDHGTSVAGFIGARGGNGIGITGVAPSVELRAYNMLLAQEYPNELAALGYQPALDNGSYTGLTSYNVDIFNMSYGRTLTYVLSQGELNYYDALIGAIEWGTDNLRNGRGALYFKAAGNEFGGSSLLTAQKCSQAANNGVTCFNTNLEYDQVFPFVIPVGTFNAEGDKSSFGNTGASIWVSGPGGEYGVYSPAMLTVDQSGCNAGYSQTSSRFSFNDFDQGKTQENLDCNYYSAFNAASASTPVVSGAAALLLEANPDLNWRDVKHILATTARKIDPDLQSKRLFLGGQSVVLEEGWRTNAVGYHFSNYFGFGALDVNEAIAMATEDYSRLPDMQVLERAGRVNNGGEIPDANAVGITETMSINQTNNLVVESVQLIASLSGTDGKTQGETNFDFSDYQVVLQSPGGTQSIVMTPFHAFDKRYAITDFPMITHAFYGESLNGDWKLIIRDLDSENGLTGEGKLVDWSLKFYVHES